MKTRILLIPTLLLALLIAPLATTGVNNTDKTMPVGVSEYAIVQLRDPPIASYEGGIPGLAKTKALPGQKIDFSSPAVVAYEQYLAQKRGEAMKYVRENSPRIEVIREYSAVLNGFAVRLNGQSTAHLWRAPGVQHVAPSALYYPAMNISPGLINAPALWAMEPGGSSNAGAGIKIGIIDTGINQTHPFFNPSGFSLPSTGGPWPKCDALNSASGVPDTSCNNTTNKVIVAKVYFTNTIGVIDARDERGHGTHVSGTAAGVSGTSAPLVGGTLSGIAPRAWLGNYNVFPAQGLFPACEVRDQCGSATSHDIAQAVEDAVRDGMDVLNLSLGGGAQPKDQLALAVNAAVDAGLVVAVAAGNSGPRASTVESPGVAEKVITVGASTNPHFLGIPVTVPSLGTFGAALGEFNNFGMVTATFTTTSPANGCSAIITPLAGKIALIARGVCTFTTKIRNAQNAGAIGVIVRNNVAGDPVAMAHDDTDPFPTIPAVMVSLANGLAMASISPGTVTLDGTVISEFVTPNADIIAGFSSRGPPPLQVPAQEDPSRTSNKVKPDVTAPGVNVYSSVTGGCGSTGCFAFFSGTSMSTPHVAGSAALLKQLHPTWSPDQIKSALVNTAKRPVLSHTVVAPLNNPIPLNNPMDRGGGRIDLAAASMATATIIDASVSWGSLPAQAGFTLQHTFTVTDVSGSPVNYAIAVNCAVCGPTFTLSTGSLNLGVLQTGSFTVTISASPSLADGDYRGDIVLTGGAVPLVIPYWVRIDPRTPSGLGLVKEKLA